MRTSISIIVAALAVGGCASSRAQPRPAPAPEARAEAAPDERGGMMNGGMMNGGMAEMCPMAVEGTTASLADVEGGVALVFTTTGDVDDLRRRVAGMAEMHNRHHDMPAGQQKEATRGRHGMMKGGMMKLPPATAHSEPVEGGARLVFIAHDPADVPVLREQVQRTAEQMGSGRCPMMEDREPPASGEHDAHHPGSAY